MTARGEPVELSKIALLLIDVQMAFVHRDAAGEPRSTPLAEGNISRLLDGFRNAGGRIVHIHHHSRQAGSPFITGQPGAVVQEFAEPAPGEAVYIKHVNASFIGTSLEDDLRRAGVERLILCGATANQCAESTARMAGNLGFNTFFVSDGVWAYGNTGPDGREHSADEVLSLTIGNLHGEFATIRSTEEILALLGS